MLKIGTASPLKLRPFDDFDQVRGAFTLYAKISIVQIPEAIANRGNVTPRRVLTMSPPLFRTSLEQGWRSLPCRSSQGDEACPFWTLSWCNLFGVHANIPIAASNRGFYKPRRIKEKRSWRGYWNNRFHFRQDPCDSIRQQPQAQSEIMGALVRSQCQKTEKVMTYIGIT
jgi:hypothetical protein